MAYSTSAPPVLLQGAIGGSASNRPQFWLYASTDAATAVRVTGYITNAKSLGMKKGDLVFSVKTDASPISLQIHIVSAINANGSGDLSDGLAVTATNSD